MKEETILRLAITLLAAAALAGCAAQPMYQWGNYDGLLYQSYKEPGQTAELQHKLEEHIAVLEGRHERVAPGLYAEVGTLYLQKGDGNTAKLWFTKERNTWPESRTLMDSMIQHATPTQPAKDAQSRR